MENLVSAKQFAERLGISVRTLEELITQGKVFLGYYFFLDNLWR